MMAASAIGVSALVASCATGGAVGYGVVNSSNSGQSGTFTIQVHCDAAHGVVSGPFSYHDRGAHVNLDGQLSAAGLVVVAQKVGGTNVFVCQPPGVDGESFTGTYHPVNDRARGGNGTMDVAFFNEGNTVLFEISLIGGAYGGYHNSSTVSDGNIQLGQV
jgi:hypothetical protein